MKYTIPIFVFFLLTFLSTPTFAQDDYTLHNTVNDCYVKFENSVYDITDYIVLHDKYLNIRSWCGNDITQDFMTKDGSGEDHKTSSYYLLEQYKLYDINSSATTPTTGVTTQQPTNTKEITTLVVKSTTKNSSPYNLVIPLILSLSLYWIPYFIIKSQKKSMIKFNAFFNTTMLLSLLIPSLGFGIFMMLRYKFPKLYDINFNFLYWHVELSLFMGLLGMSHFLSRLKMYLLQLGKRN